MPEAAAPVLGETLLAESVAAPMFAADASFIPAAGGLAELGAMPGMAGALGVGAEGLGGISGLFGTGAEGALANSGVSAATSAAAPGASQIASTLTPEATSALQTQSAVDQALQAQQVQQAQQLQQAQQAANAAQQAESMKLYSSAVPTSPSPMGPNPLPDITGAVEQYPLGSSAERQALYGNTEGAYGLEGYDNRFSPPVAPSGGGITDMLKNGFGSAKKWIEENPKMAAAGAGLAGYMLGKGSGAKVPERKPYDGPLSKFHYDPAYYTPYTPQPPTNPYMAHYADGGMADLGGYSDGGRMLKGPGDGMSDNIPATIAGKQPARLANEEFVVPADVVSHLGNGSSEAGAKQLYKMMDRVRQARTGNKKQGKQINPDKYLA